MGENQPAGQKKQAQMDTGTGVALGMAFGLLFGVAIGNIALGLPLGIAMGIAFSQPGKKSGGEDEKNEAVQE